MSTRLGRGVVPVAGTSLSLNPSLNSGLNFRITKLVCAQLCGASVR